MEEMSSNLYNNNQEDKKTFLQKIGLNITTKVTNRDLVIFTQDLYLLKKANFNNIHALSTIIETEKSRRIIRISYKSIRRSS